MKKCASCSKDLPDAALHCVFCGAKQPPAAAPQGLAKTVMGYSASEMIEQMKQRPGASTSPTSMPPSAPYSPPPRPSPAPSRPQPPPPLPPTLAEPPPPRFAGNDQPTAYAKPPPSYEGPTKPGPGIPPAGSNAPTMFAGNAPASQPSYPAPAPLGSGPGPSMGGPMGGRSGPTPSVPMPHNVAPAPMPAAPPPYLASQTAARAGRPVEPWKDSLRFTMFVWGVVLLAVFATPLSIDPLGGYWNVVADAPGTMKLGPLIMAAIGLLGIVIGSMPMAPAPRGLVAAVLGFVGIVMPTILALVDGATPSWQSLVALIVPLALIPGLLVRQEYRDAMLPRILVTIGVIAALVPHLVPNDAGVPLVNEFKLLIDAPLTDKLVIGIGLMQVVVVVLCLLAWLPAPSSGTAKVFAWLLILWPLVVHVTLLAAHADQILDALKASPNLTLFGPLALQIEKGATAIPAGWAVIAAYTAITTYGLATVFGKQLE